MIPCVALNLVLLPPAWCRCPWQGLLVLLVFELIEASHTHIKGFCGSSDHKRNLGVTEWLLWDGWGSMASAGRVGAFMCAAMCFSSGICTPSSGGKWEGRCCRCCCSGADQVSFFCERGSAAGAVINCWGSPPKSLPPGSFQLGFAKASPFFCLFYLILCLAFLPCFFFHFLFVAVQANRS